MFPSLWLGWRINHHPSPSGCRLLFNGARVTGPTRANGKTDEAEKCKRQRQLPPAVSSDLKVGTLSSIALLMMGGRKFHPPIPGPQNSVISSRMIGHSSGTQQRGPSRGR